MLHVHHADRADHLVAALADVLHTAPTDAFTPEVIAVHSRGVERWIAQRLSHRLGTSPARSDGVAANLTFPFPGALVGEVVAHAAGHEPDADPWHPDRLMWPLLDVVDEAVRGGDGDRLGPLRTHVVDDRGRPSDRRLGAVRRVAELFDRYAVHRPAMLQAWAGRHDVGSDGRALLERDCWQPRLWRAVHARIGTASGPERLAEATAAIARGRTVAGDPLKLELPDRLAVFGVTALSATTVEVLAALAEGPTTTAPDGRDVHLFLLHPSPVLWRRTATVLTDRAVAAVAATGRTALPTREDDPTAGLARDPLLAAWGRDTRELQLVVSTVAAEHHDHSGDLNGDDRSGDPVAHTPTAAADRPSLLTRLQDAVRHDLARRDDDALPHLDPADRSVQLHRCHGPTRQVEVLRDVLLHLLADDPRLEPRDVVVLCPDIERFAPLIEAVFGGPLDRTGGDDGVQLRVQLADRALRRTNPLLRVVAELLELADGRVSASTVLDLCTRGPVRRRFGLDEDDLGRLETWLDSTGIRWGFDADHRSERGVPTAVNTWRSGLDRLLAGVAVADERLRTVGHIAPEDDVEGDAVELAGRFAELLARLDTIVRTMRTPRPVGAWLDVLTEAVGQLCEVDPDESWQEIQLGRAFGEVRDAVRGTAADTARLPLSLPEVRGLLGDRLEGAPSRAAHRTGDLTVCTLVPMRSVPHEVVVLLGMDDEVFPRRTVPDGDDLLATAPLLGDRDPRTEDRQLLLDALLAAGSHLVVLTTGHDERTGEPRPPAVPIGELLDVVDRTVTTDVRDGHDAPLPASATIAVDHPLQPFDPRRFAPAGLGVTGRRATDAGVPFGFDLGDLAAAQALAGTRTPPRPFLTERLAPLDTAGPLPLRDLISFLHHPVQALLSQRLDVTYPRGDEVRDDRVPVELESLAAWGVGDRLLAEVIVGRDPDRWLEVERSRGTLPPGDLGDEGVAEARRTVEVVRALAVDAGVPLADAPEAVAIDLTLPGGHRLVGAVPVIGTTRRAVAYSRLGRKARLSAWVELLALTAAAPDVVWRAVTLGRARPKAKDADGEPAAASVSTLAPGGPREFTIKKGATRTIDNPLGPPDGPAEERRDAAIELLTQLVELRDRGLCGPALLPCETAGSYAETAWGNHIGAHRQTPIVAARGAWSNTSGRGYPGEDEQHPHRLVLGAISFEQLFDIPPDPEESGPGWDDDPSRLGRLGRRVWWPLLAAEEIEDR